MIWRSASLISSSSLLFVSLTVSDLLLSLQTLCSLLVVDQSRLSDIFLLTYMVSSVCLSLAIPADKTISLACPFQYHNIVTRWFNFSYIIVTRSWSPKFEWYNLVIGVLKNQTVFLDFQGDSVVYNFCELKVISRIKPSWRHWMNGTVASLELNWLYLSSCYYLMTMRAEKLFVLGLLLLKCNKIFLAEPTF